MFAHSQQIRAHDSGTVIQAQHEHRNTVVQDMCGAPTHVMYSLCNIHWRPSCDQPERRDVARVKLPLPQRSVMWNTHSDIGLHTIV